MNVTVLRKACIRCGLCCAACPEVFSLETYEDSAVATTDEIPQAWKNAVMAAANGCPTGAIAVQ